MPVLAAGKSIQDVLNEFVATAAIQGGAKTMRPTSVTRDCRSVIRRRPRLICRGCESMRIVGEDSGAAADGDRDLGPVGDEDTHLPRATPAESVPFGPCV